MRLTPIRYEIGCSVWNSIENSSDILVWHSVDYPLYCSSRTSLRNSTNVLVGSAYDSIKSKTK